MTQHEDQLREAFVSHEHLAPDSAGILAGLQGRVKGQQRRRRATQAAGALLGTGLIAGGFAVPAVLAQGGGGHQEVVVQDPAAAPALPAPLAVPSSQTELDHDLNAYFAAGYGYDDAIRLAKIWQVKNEPVTVKAEAGRRLLAGDTLPIKPGPETTKYVPSGEEAAVEKFFAAGYDYADAVELSKLWKTKTPYDAKAEAGQRLLDGKTVPIKPRPGDDPAVIR